MPRLGTFMYQVSVADGFADDCDELILRCSKKEPLTYHAFCKIWKEMRFPSIYKGRVLSAEIAELSEELLQIAKRYFTMDTSNFEESVAGLFLVYALYNQQPYPGFASLRLTPDDVPAVNWIQTVARRERRFDVLYILGGVLVKASQYHVESRERGMDVALRKYLDGCIGFDKNGVRPKGVLLRQNEEMDVLREMSALTANYKAAKMEVAQLEGVGAEYKCMDYADPNTSSELSASLKKLINGILEDDVEESPTTSKADSASTPQDIKQRAMKSAISSVKHLTSVEERPTTSSRKPKSEITSKGGRIRIGRFTRPVTSRSPQKKTRYSSPKPSTSRDISDDEDSFPKLSTSRDTPDTDSSDDSINELETYQDTSKASIKGKTLKTPKATSCKDKLACKHSSKVNNSSVNSALSKETLPNASEETLPNISAVPNTSIHGRNTNTSPGLHSDETDKSPNASKVKKCKGGVKGSPRCSTRGTRSSKFAIGDDIKSPMNTSVDGNCLPYSPAAVFPSSPRNEQDTDESINLPSIDAESINQPSKVLKMSDKNILSRKEGPLRSIKDDKKSSDHLKDDKKSSKVSPGFYKSPTRASLRNKPVRNSPKHVSPIKELEIIKSPRRYKKRRKVSSSESSSDDSEFSIPLESDSDLDVSDDKLSSADDNEEVEAIQENARKNNGKNIKNSKNRQNKSNGQNKVQNDANEDKDRQVNIEIESLPILISPKDSGALEIKLPVEEMKKPIHKEAQTDVRVLRNRLITCSDVSLTPATNNENADNPSETDAQEVGESCKSYYTMAKISKVTKSPKDLNFNVATSQSDSDSSNGYPKIKRPQRNEQKKSVVKSKFSRMGILPVANFKDRVKEKKL